MNAATSDQRVLAFDVRRSRLGFVIFEGSARLLDWGVKNFRGGVNAVCVPLRVKVTNLVSDWKPDAIVLKTPVGQASEKTNAIQTSAKSRGVPVRVITPETITDAFPYALNKYERARSVVGFFPELGALLPTKRKAWQTEHYQMSIFDAAAIGVAYFRELGEGKTEHGAQ